jgi:site-specific DNA-methyltransferase (adenine-specific)
MIPSIKAPPYRLDQLDAIEWLRQQAPESIDLIVTDIAYESLEEHRAVGTTTRLKKAWFTIFPNDRILELFQSMYRVLKKNAHLYFFCDSTTMFVSKPLGEQAGFKFWKPLVWDKGSIGMGYHYRGQVEYVLFFEKGKREKLANLGVSDLLPHKKVLNGYPTEKPKDLLNLLISQSSKPGDVVADPFFGSGATADAALELGRAFVGTDISDEAHRVTRERLSIYYV